MISLFIDTSLSDVSIALLKDGKLLSCIHNNIPGEHSVYVSKYIEDILENNNKSSDDVNEIIVVDDCSTDESTKIVKEYTKKYNNIILLENEKNMGVSYSRNRGIENTKSEYIMFCDSDDWYEKQATKKMMEKVEDGADFVFVGYYITYKDGRKIEAKYNTFNNIEITKETCISYLPITSWAKLIKKSILVEHNIKYPVGIKNCEELPVIPVAGFYAQKIVYIDECLYNYFQRENSASNHRLEDLSFYDITYEKFKKGIGTHAYSEIVYDSSGYDVFDTWVGLDKFVSNQNASSVIFKVYVDGELKAQTDMMKSNSPKERLIVDVRNSKKVKLVVEEADNGDTWDHADWADAKFRTFSKFDSTELENTLVEIKDKNLKLSIQQELGLPGEIRLRDMKDLVSLSVKNVKSLDGLQYAINLKSLNIENNEIKDLSPLKNLKKLTNLKANPQMIYEDLVLAKDKNVSVDYNILNRNGDKLTPTSISIKDNRTWEYTNLNVKDCIDEDGKIVGLF